MRNKKFLPPSDRFSVRSLHRQQPKPLLLQQKSSMIKFTLVPKIKSLTIKTQRPMKKIKSIVFKSKIKPKILGKNSSLILDSTLKKHPLEVIPTTEIESNNKIMIDPLLMAEEDSSANIPISPPHPPSPSPPPPLSTNYIDISIPKQISSVPKQPKSSSSFETSPDKMDHIVPVPVAEYKDRSDQQVSSMSGTMVTDADGWSYIYVWKYDTEDGGNYSFSESPGELLEQIDQNQSSSNQKQANFYLISSQSGLPLKNIPSPSGSGTEFEKNFNQNQ
ncbi:hypothetical protein QR98_0011480 [Sarcoptes scabiei]|uniref:Uncharacterized protein n=1 Tax=Sarcoptes scabiei TaxID=52283 RepID=A0A131ZX87_SARSC|nr:hypothetical protein QR98_0011480 [Sarcoptes scabiei]